MPRSDLQLAELHKHTHKFQMIMLTETEKAVILFHEDFLIKEVSKKEVVVDSSKFCLGRSEWSSTVCIWQS